MDKDLKAAWVADLRSGKAKQGRRFLNKRGKFCCLGRLCEVAGFTPVYSPEIKAYDYKEYDSIINDEQELSDEVLERMGISLSVQVRLMRMNDAVGKKQHCDFPEIADWIETHDLVTGKEI